MREIKFRGKVKYNGNHKFSGDWIYGYYRNNDNRNAFITETLDEYSDYILDETEVEESTIGQYIGLKDENGKEIYEGDVIKIDDDYELYGLYAGELYQVYYGYGAFRLKPKYQSENKGVCIDDAVGMTVVGNIYDNPELIK